jgi:hypothetical protein
MDMPRSFTEPHRAALALLANGCAGNRKTAQFLGCMAADFRPPTPKERTWLVDLLRKADSELV